MIDLIIGVAFIIVSARMLYEGLAKAQPAHPAAEIPGTVAAKGALGAGIGALTGIIGLGGANMHVEIDQDVLEGGV